MVSLKGEHIYLRALEPEDLEFLFRVENDMQLWQLSNTQTPYSRYVLKQYLDNAHKDIFEVKQLRLVICKHDTSPIGLIDVFDFDPKNKRAGLGIVIPSLNDREKGFAKEALHILVNYCFNILQLHQVYANIEAHNIASLNLFKGCGFQIVGLKKDWNFNDDSYIDEYMLQLIKA